LKHDKKTSPRSDYRQLRRKIFFKTFLMFALALLVIAGAYRLIFSGRFADWTVGFLDRFVFQNYETAYRVFQMVFRNNMDLWFLAAVLVIFLVCLSVYLHFFTKYFGEIDRGIASLAEEDSGDIVMPSELAATERNLNYIKHTLREREMAARLAEQRKNDMVMYLAHDIRTPLTSVIGYLSLLDEAPDMPESQKAKFTRVALDKAYRLEGLVNEFFEITRYNTQEIKLQKEDIDLYYMLVQMIDEFYPIFSAKGNTAALQAKESMTAYGDPVKLARVFNNILKNAVAYSWPKSAILIRAQQREGDVVISIQNHGPTIPAEKLADIFEKFYRLDEARTSNTGGSGLGLAIAREIVHAHGGTITAESADEITTFTVTLPLR